MSNTIFYFLVRVKWLIDSIFLPLCKEQRTHYVVLHRFCMRELGRFPRLIRCRDFNDKIQWLKLFNQCDEIVRCSDKIAVRGFVRERLGDGYLPSFYGKYVSLQEIDWASLPDSFVVKTNHDSGTVVLVRDKRSFNPGSVADQLRIALSNVYGTKNGEWSYSNIQPFIFIEEFLGDPASCAPADYKFHCVNGDVRWLQYIYDRGENTKEAIVGLTGDVLPIHFDHNMEYSQKFKKPDQWAELLSVARKLSSGFKYVRVDLYLVEEQIYVGELTFYPLSGTYRSSGQIELGRLLDFSRSTFQKPIWSDPRQKKRENAYS